MNQEVKMGDVKIEGEGTFKFPPGTTIIQVVIPPKVDPELRTHIHARTIERVANLNAEIPGDRHMMVTRKDIKDAS